MPSNRKCYHRGSLIEICFRTEEGLPLVATPYMRAIIQSILARAFSKYRLTIVAFVVMGNHIHVLVVVNDPKDVSGFIEYLKRELAHAINRLLGRINRTVWVDGSDVPVIMDSEKALDRLLYVYTNPQKADLTDTIDEYPNLSSWEAFLAGGSTETFKRISRPSVPTLPNRTLSLADQQRLADQLIEEAHEEFELTIEPDAWMQCFPDLDDADPEQIRDELIERIRNEEQVLGTLRTKPTIGAHALKLETMRRPHTPKKRSKRMLCLASTRIVRIAYATWRKDLHQAAKDKYKQWCEGDHRVTLPPGMFWPGGRLVTPCDVDIQEFCSDF